MVPKKGLEPPHPCGYMDLNHARLPIPPLRQRNALRRSRWTAATASVTKASTPVKPERSTRARTAFNIRKARFMTPPIQTKSIPEQQAAEIRRLSHDLS